jgi:Bacterial Ig-like domain
VNARAAVAAAVAAVALGGCAKSAFPPGGPIDTVPPYILATVPADSSLRVSRTTSVGILFSEGVDHQTVRDGFRIYPPAGRPRFDWSGRRLAVTWDRPLAESTTYIVLLSGSARDLRGVPMGKPLTILFSTGDSLDHGRIQGVLRAKTLPRGGIPIWAFPESLGMHPDSTQAMPSYATETDTGGVYALTGMPFNRGFTIHAFYDMNHNGSMESATDILPGYPSPVRLTPEHPVADSINIVAVNPLAPGTVTGTIASRDSTARFRIEARDAIDSTFVAKRIERHGPGIYSLPLPAGRYRLIAVEIPAAEGSAEIKLPSGAPLDVAPEEEYGPIDFDFTPLESPPKAPGDSPPPNGKE